MVWFEQYGWNDNPFKTDPTSDSLVIEDIRHTLEEYIESEYVVNLYGATGTGKSSLLRWFSQNLKGKYYPVYINCTTMYESASPKTPREERELEGFKAELRKQTFPSFFDRFRGAIFQPSLFEELKKHFRKKGNKMLVILLDEVNEISDEKVSSYLRSINEDVKCSMVLSGIKPLSEIKVFKGSFREGRVINEIAMREISFDEAKKMMSIRIEEAGGHKIKPFTDASLNRLIQISGALPRSILSKAGKSLEYLAEQGKKDEITASDITTALTFTKIRSPASYSEETIMPEEAKEEKEEKEIKKEKLSVTNFDAQFEALSDNQRKIVQALTSPKTIPELQKEMNLTYGSIVTDLNRLMLTRDVPMMKKKGIEVPLVIKSKGRPHRYSLSERWKQGMVKE